MLKKVVFAILTLALAVPAFAQETTDIEMWIAFTDGRLDWAKERAVEFNELFPEYNVVVEGYGNYNDAFDATVLAAEQGNPPAITHFFEAATQEARDAVGPDGAPLFASVEEALAGRTEINGVPVVLDDVISAAANYYTLDGEFTSMPWNTSSSIMFSNMEMLSAAGIETPPSTWAEVLEACEKIMMSENAPDNCITWPNHSWFFEQTLGQQGALLANNDNGRSARADEVFINSDAAVAYLDWWKSLNDAGYYVYTGVVRDWGGTYNAFIGGQVAMLIYSSSDTSIITADGIDAGITVQASLMPRNSEVEFAGNLIGGATLWLNNGLDEVTQDGALMFMNFISNPENAAGWHELTGYEPITNGSLDFLASEGFFEANPNNTVASTQLAEADDSAAARGALIGNFVAIRDVITDAIEEVLVNGVDPAEALAAANEDANQLLADYNELYSE